MHFLVYNPDGNWQVCKDIEKICIDIVNNKKLLDLKVFGAGRVVSDKPMLQHPHRDGAEASRHVSGNLEG